MKVIERDCSWTFWKSDIGERGFLLIVDIFIGIIIGEFLFVHFYFLFNIFIEC